MNKIEQDILLELAELDRIIKTMRATHSKPDLVAKFSRIDELASRLPPGTSSELTHFLQRKSYEKARAWLEQRHGAVPRDNCGH
jgi:hypothetical protein